MFDEIVDIYNSGYENDEGGGGYIYMDKNGCVLYRHYYNIADTEVAGSTEIHADTSRKPIETISSRYHCIEENLRRITESMKSAGITRANITYLGEGDSGSVDNIETDAEDDSVLENTKVEILLDKNSRYTEQFKNTKISNKSASLHEAILHIADEVVEEYHGGFEINNGGGGEITISAENGSLIWEGYNNTNYESESSIILFGESVPPEEWLLRAAEAEAKGYVNVSSAEINPLTQEQREAQNKRIAEVFYTSESDDHSSAAAPRNG